ncbi:MAG: hypothetical protein V3V33_12565 [Candidatus Lokiarchaeia archaeon]
MSSDSENNNTESLVKTYIETDYQNKNRVIEYLAENYDISIKEVLKILEQYHIPSPKIKIQSRIEAIDLDKTVIDRTPKLKSINLDENIAPAVSMIRFFDDMGWSKLVGSEKGKALSTYIYTKYGINSFNIFLDIMEKIIQNNGVFDIEEYVENINLDKFTTPDYEYEINKLKNEIMLEQTKFMREELFKKTPEEEKAEREKARLFKEVCQIIDQARKPKPIVDQQLKKIFDSVLTSKPIIKQKPKPPLIKSKSPTGIKEFLEVK